MFYNNDIKTQQSNHQIKLWPVCSQSRELNWTHLTCTVAVACFFWPTIHDLKSVQALHGLFFRSPLCSCSLPELSPDDVPGTVKGKLNPAGLEADAPLGPAGAAMFARSRTWPQSSTDKRGRLFITIENQDLNWLAYYLIFSEQWKQ